MHRSSNPVPSARPLLALLLIAGLAGCTGVAHLQSEAEETPAHPTLEELEKGGLIPAASASPDAPTGSDTPPAPTSPAEWIGRTAPDFRLCDVEGTWHELAAMTAAKEGERSIVVLEWTSLVCSFVKRHYARAYPQALVKKFAQEGVTWVAIDSSLWPIAHPIKVERFVEKRHVAHPILLDPTGVVGEAFGVATTPTVVILVDGVVRFHGAFDDDVWGRKPEAREHVKEALEAILAGEEIPVATPAAYGSPIQYFSVEQARRAAREEARRAQEEAREKPKKADR